MKSRFLPNVKSNRLVETRNAIARFIAYSGPALIVSIGYMDPGNYGTDIQGGASFGYSLLWVVWLSSAMAMMIQYLSGKLGIATNMSLAEILRKKLGRKTLVIPYWLSTELVITATDLAEYLGTVIALNLLFNVPLIYAAVFGAVDVIIILGLTSRRFRLLEQLFLLFVSIISFGYLYEIFTVRPDPREIFIHSFVPGFASSHELFIGVGIIGATVMPHVVFLHSALTKERSQGKNIEEKKRMRKFHLAETIIVLTIAGMINAAILIMSAVAFGSSGSQVESISEAYKTLVPIFGLVAGTVFLVTLLSSGLASSVAGTLAGQVVMEGFLDKKINVWLRRIVTRFINVIPTTIAIFFGFDPLQILVYSQVILSLLIPLAIVPLIVFTADKNVMGEFVNRKITSAIAISFALIIIAFDSYILISG